jgi:imidazolonepropionase
MIDSGLAVALATDFNPGSCFTESIPLIIALSTLQMKMSIEEVITALTLNGAAALGRADKIGSIDLGKVGDLVIHNCPSYKFLAYHIAYNNVETVIKNGKIVSCITNLNQTDNTEEMEIKHVKQNDDRRITRRNGRQ